MLPLLELNPSSATGPLAKRQKTDGKILYLKSCKYGICEYLNNVDEFYQYAAIVMYANQFSDPITRFQRHTAAGFPTFTAKDTDVYNIILQQPNGSEAWSKIEPYIQRTVDDEYNTGTLPPGPDDLYYYLVCWMTMRNVPGLEPLLHEVGTDLPTDAEDERYIIEELIRKPDGWNEDPEFPWKPPNDKLVTRAFLDSIKQDYNRWNYSRWKPLCELALMRVSSLLDAAFDTFGSAFEEVITTFRGVSKPYLYRGLWYNEDTTPSTNRWLQALPAPVLSTSGRRDQARGFCHKDPSCVLYVFRVPAGMKVIQPSKVIRMGHGGFKEDEYVFPRGCTYELLRQTKETMNGHTVHVLEVAVGRPSGSPP